MNIFILQGSGGTHLKHGRKYDHCFYCKFLADSDSKRIVKIG